MKEQIVEMSGLSPRVIRVWFQNKRCKDKKNQIKFEMQQERVSIFDQSIYFGISKEINSIQKFNDESRFRWNRNVLKLAMIIRPA